MRPPVDVIVPFAGTPERLREVADRLARLELREGDTAIVVDNRPEGEPVEAAVRVLPAREQRSSYYARNQGTKAGSAPWLLFLDGDVRFAPTLLDDLFADAPSETTAVLAGGIEDIVVDDGPVARWLRAREAMSQRNTMAAGERPYAQTAHCAVRRTAFEAVGGFTEHIRSAGDADLCFRLADAGWGLEVRGASVQHEARARVRPLVGQLARHGAGVSWLEARYPGSFEAPRRLSGLSWWLARSAPAAATARIRGDRDRAAGLLLEPVTALAFNAGRRLSNDAPTGRPSKVSDFRL